MTTPYPAHYIRLRFSPPTDRRKARWIATWEGWPEPGQSPNVRRYVPGPEMRTAAQQAAAAFVEWLSKMPGYKHEGDTPPRFEADSVTYGAGLTGDEAHVLVRTRVVE